jgi:hypothetical protein
MVKSKMIYISLRFFHCSCEVFYCEKHIFQGCGSKSGSKKSLRRHADIGCGTPNVVRSVRCGA